MVRSRAAALTNMHPSSAAHTYGWCGAGLGAADSQQTPGSQKTPSDVAAELTLRPLVDTLIEGVLALRVDAYFRA